MNGDPLSSDLIAWGEREITRSRLGPVYGRVRKPSTAEAAHAMRERQTLFDECLDRGARLHEGNRAKIYSGDLSTGCRSCAEGTWSCLDFERRCTRRCFFCPRDPGCLTVAPPRDAESRVEVDSPGDYASFLGVLGYRGAAFSGGEPFMSFHRMLDYTREIRATLGDSVHVWAYTNGDLVDEDRLPLLAAAGLDELRVDLAARGYDPSPLETATRWIETVAVEVPAIPEDFDRVRALLPRLEALGVKHVNLHQLYFTTRNAEAFARRGYTIVHSAGYGFRGVVLESELTALRLLREALATGSSLSVNYCSALYKDRFQARGFRRRLVSAITSLGPLAADVGTVTPLGFLRRLSVAAVEAPPLLGLDRGAGRPAPLAARDGVVFVPLSLLDSPALAPVPVEVEYFQVAIDEPPNASATTRWSVAIGPGRELRLAAGSPIAKAMLGDARSKSLFRRLLDDGAPPTDAADRFMSQFADVEYLDRGLPDHH